MKKSKIVSALIIIGLVFIFGSLISRRSLIITNIHHLPVSEWTKKHIISAYFHFDEDVKITLDEVHRQFMYTDSLTMLNSKEVIQEKENLSGVTGYDSPLFESDINQYFFYAIIKNSSLAGEESLLSEAHYIWLPWGWYNIKSQITGGA